MSRATLADTLGVSVRMVSYWENGERECTFEMHVQLQITLIVQRIIFLVEKSIDEKNRAMRSIFL